MKYPSFLAFLLDNNDKYLAMYEIAAKVSTLADRDGITTLINVVDFVRNKDCKSYVVSDSLLDALDDVDCQEVGPWHLKGTQAFHFIFKRHKLGDGEDFYKEMFLQIMPPGVQLGMHKNMSETEHKIGIYLTADHSSPGENAAMYIGARYTEGSTIEQILESCSDEIGEFKISEGMSSKVLRLALNLVLYINSPDPEIMRLKPQVYNTKSFREGYFQKDKDERHLFGVFSLGWDFHGRQYNIDIGTRKGHFKWQPCGKLWSERKLIFVATTTVNYGKGKST